MRILFRIAAFVGVLFVAFSSLTEGTFGYSKNEKSVFLFAGLDDAAENTDSLILVGYDSVTTSASVVQLPRDTYINIGKRRNKINQIYRQYRLEGDSKSEAMRKTSMLISDTFGIKIDGYVAITTEGFRDIVDSLGGVKITLSEPMKLGSANNSLNLTKGENFLNGEDAEFFVRSRAEYITADIGRMDAQKIFLGGLYRTLVEGANIQTLLKMLAKASDDITTDINLAEAVVSVVKHASKFKGASVRFLTMPGKAIADESGIWYYAINRASAIEVLKNHLFYSDGIFDINNLLLNEADENFRNIYYSSAIYYKVYSEDELSEINIPKTE